jgi:hypothetical protein
MAYTIISPFIGVLPIGNVDSGVLSAINTSNGGTTYIPSPPLQLGLIVRATDPTYGGGEFILLTGNTGVAVGTVVQYDASTFVPTVPTAAALNKSGEPLAVSMSANTSTTNWSWYQISGTAVVKKTTVKFTNKQAVGFISTGVVGKNASGVQIIGARTANVSSVASATTTVLVTISRPVAQGRIT